MVHADEPDAAQVIELGQVIETAGSASGYGGYDGWELKATGASIYVYGESADRLFTIIEPLVRTIALRLSGIIVRRYGGPCAREVQGGF